MASSTVSQLRELAESMVSKILRQISAVASAKRDIAMAIVEKGGAVPSLFSLYGSAIADLRRDIVDGLVLSPTGTEWPACEVGFVMPSAVSEVRASGRALPVSRAITSLDLGQVTGIYGDGCFSGLQMTEVSGSSVREIGASFAFSNCPNLQTVSFPVCSSLGSAIWAFASCSNLRFVTLPNVVSIPASCFAPYVTSEGSFVGCKVSGVSFPACTTVGVSAFAYATALSSVNLPVCQAVGEGAFQGCTALKEISLPSCTEVGSYAFWGASALESVNLPQCSAIGYGVFSRCFALSCVSMPNVVSIPSSCFTPEVVAGSLYYYSKIGSLDLPRCTSIGSSAIERCSALSVLSVPAVEYLHEWAITDCASLSVLSLPSVQYISMYGVFFVPSGFILDLQSVTVVPGLGGGILRYGSSWSDCTIRVPSSLFTEFVYHSRWSMYSSIMESVSAE